MKEIYFEEEEEEMEKKKMYGNEERGRWEDLPPEILSLILVRIPAEERVGTASLVCKSWMACVLSPYCWADIDIQEWCCRRRRCLPVELIDSAVMKLISLSRGTFHRLSAFRLGDAGFAFAAIRGKHLKVLEIPMSEVNDKIVKMFAESLASLSVLDISYCLNITHIGIEALGKKCKSLIHLKRNMPPILLLRYGSTSNPDDREAMVIAQTMPSLQRLQLGFGFFGNRGLDAILAQCKALTLLDIQGCWSVKLEGELEDRIRQLLAFRSPMGWIYEQVDEEEYPASESE